MYQYQNNVLSIPAKILYEELALIAYDTYHNWCKRGKLVRTKEGRGKGNTAWVSFHDIKEDWVKEAVKKCLGSPDKIVTINDLEKYIDHDNTAAKYFAAHRKPDGSTLSPEKQLEKTTNARILNAIKTVFKERDALVKRKKRVQAWKNISDAVNHLATIKYGNDTVKWQFKLPGNERSLQRRYNEYIKKGYEALIHKGEGSKNALVINNEIGDFLLAQYSLPIKLTIPEVLERYEMARVKNEQWRTLSNSAVYNYLYEPERERLWTLARHGKEAYQKKYKRTHTIDKSNWFPNCYWAIDGTKLDWIHVWDESSNKMGAKLKINVMFDVYSEKIIGWDVSFTESHIEHFNTIKMAVNESQCRPYFLTYDNQGGHKMKRMQTLYDSVVAKTGGHHHPGKAKQHGNPAEGLFRRIQQQVINKFWWSDGQSITVKRDDNKMNTDFILENKSLLKTVEELIESWVAAVNIWNNKKHPHFEATRNEVYAHEMPMCEELSLFDIMDKMWIDQKKTPITYKAHGLLFRLGNKKLEFEVYDADGNIDLEFRRKNIGKKFIIRYDPSFLDGYIQLCAKDEEGNIYNVANAQPKRKPQPVPVLMQPGDKEQWEKDNKINDLELQRDLGVIEKLLHRTGITPEKEMEDQDLIVKLKGNMNKFHRSKVESEENLTIATSRF